jgi:Domain of unknown function (DUF4282)
MEKGFFGSLFDISFSSLITTKVIKVLYVISLIVIGLFALFFVIGAFASSAALGVVTLIILAPLGALLYAVYTRVILEFIIVVFRIAEYNGELVALTRQQMGLPAHTSSLGIGGTPPAAAAPAATAPPATAPAPATTPPPPATPTPPETPSESTPPPTDAGGDGESAS